MNTTFYKRFLSILTIFLLLFGQSQIVVSNTSTLAPSTTFKKSANQPVAGIHWIEEEEDVEFTPQERADLESRLSKIDDPDKKRILKVVNETLDLTESATSSIQFSPADVGELNDIIRVHNESWQENIEMQLNYRQMEHLVKQEVVFVLKVAGTIKGVLLTYPLKTDGDIAKLGELPLWENMMKGKFDREDQDTIIFWAIGIPKGLHLGAQFAEKAREYFKERYSYVVTFSPIIGFDEFVEELRGKGVSPMLIKEYGIFLYLVSLREEGYQPYLDYIAQNGFVPPEEFFKEQKEKLRDIVENFHVGRNGAAIVGVFPYKEGFTRPDSPYYTAAYCYQGLQNQIEGFRDLMSLADGWNEEIFNNKYIKGFRHFGGSEIVREIGAKGANLSILFNLGAPVLPGFNLSNHALRQFLNQYIPGEGKTLAEVIEDLTSTLTPSSSDEDYHTLEMKIRYYIANIPFPEDIRESIENAYQKLKEMTGFEAFACRSSSISIAEDSLMQSFPGMFTSVLNRKGSEQILEGIKRVWMSQWSKSALRFRLDNGMAQSEVDMGVVMQAQLPSEISGVFYTQAIGTDPKDARVGELTAGKGLGEGVVEGKMTPDWYRVDNEGTVIAQRTGSQAEAKIIDEFGGTVERKLAKRTRPLLNDQQVKEFTRLVNKHIDRFEEVSGQISPFGYDVEWAMSKGIFYIFQVRPIPIPTTHPDSELYTMLSQLALDRENLLHLAEVLSKEKISEFEIQELLPILLEIRGKIASNQSALKVWKSLMDYIGEKIVFETEFLQIPDYLIELYRTLAELSKTKLAGEGLLDDIFEAYLKALRLGHVPLAPIENIAFIRGKLSTISEAKIPGLKEAYLDMVLNMELLHFNASSFAYPWMMKDSDPDYSKLLDDLLIAKLSSWEKVDLPSSSEILGLLDAIWERLVKERPESYGLFRDGVRELFLATKEDERGVHLKFLEHNKYEYRDRTIQALLMPYIVNKRYPELFVSIFGADVGQAITNLLQDSRFEHSFNFGTFFEVGFELMLKKEDFENSLKDASLLDRYPIDEIIQLYPYLVGEIPYPKKSVSIKTADGGQRYYSKIDLDFLGEEIVKIDPYFIFRRELPKILASPDFWLKHKIETIKEAASSLNALIDKYRITFCIITSFSSGKSA